MSKDQSMKALLRRRKFSFFEDRPGGRARIGVALFQVLAPSCVACILGFADMSIHGQAAATDFVYVGTYTQSMSKGIYSYRFDSKTGQLKSLGLAAEIPNPSFNITDRSHRFLYAATEMDDKDSPKHGGSISSYSIDPRTGALKFVNKVYSGGNGTCHLGLDNTGKILFAVNYFDGSVVSFSINKDGSIGERTGFDQHTGSSVNPVRQPSPHPHEVVPSPDNRYLFVPDLGADRVYAYDIDVGKRTFAPHNPAFVTVKPGLGPRHFVFSPDAKFAYLVCEIGSTVVAFSYDSAHGSLTEIQAISTLPSDFTGEDASAEIHLDRSGHHLYVSNRGNDSISVFAVDPSQGKLTKTQNISTQGKWPRNFEIDPSGKFLLVANQNTNDLDLFAIDQENGQLKPTGQSESVGAPVSILFVPAE